MRNLRKGITLAVLGVLILGAVWGTSLIGSIKEDETMGAINDGFVPNRSIPAIDASTPNITETATFALG